eukprot:TRINITY_DN68084_c0_g1_i1.p1 TRINITY_DN68084_c0_g1~~TRINITY_DN68084_c0_g1_i1.p1  ORF type:complete len:619 (+),score=66.26 TRINITY_DN68084_c0_g1_i1:102-1859(+)
MDGNEVQVWLTTVGSDARAQNILHQQASTHFKISRGSGLVRHNESIPPNDVKFADATLQCDEVPGALAKACKVVPPEGWRSQSQIVKPLFVAMSDECSNYAAYSGCGWTSEYNCPGQTGGPHQAGDDGSIGYRCCCEEGGWRTVSVSVKPGTKHQTMIGYGAGLPQSSAHVLQSLKSRDAQLYQDIMHRLFGTGNGSAGISMMRFPIGSCDFSLVEATYDDFDNDYDLIHFSPDADSEKIIATLLDAKKINPRLKLMATPWSPPAWLKSGKTLDGRSSWNTIIDSDRAYQTYAKFIANVASTFAARGLPLEYMSLQNEPLFGNGGYPGMYLSAQQAARLAKELEAVLGSSGPKLLAYDHNWDHPEYPEEAISASHAFAGTAWHCYGGRMVDAQDRLHSTQPDLEQLFTECTASFPDSTCDISKGMDSFGWDHEWDMSNLFLGSASHWGQAGMKWLLALDEHCGPVLPQVTYRWGRPLVSIPSTASSIRDVTFQQDFHTVAHMGRFVRPGSRRVETSKTGGTNAAIIEAFDDSSAGTTTLIAMNKDHSNVRTLMVRNGEHSFSYTMPAWSTAVMVWRSARSAPIVV